jgi:uncharacterized cupin superfamily protein
MQVHKLTETMVEPDEYYLPEEKRLVGNPKQTLWLEYTDESRKFFAGVWQSEVGKWRVTYTEEEYCQILQGTSVITDQAGNSITVSAGDRFVIPGGFIGTWEVLAVTRKNFVIYEPEAAAARGS